VFFSLFIHFLDVFGSFFTFHMQNTDGKDINRQEERERPCELAELVGCGRNSVARDKRVRAKDPLYSTAPAIGGDKLAAVIHRHPVRSNSVKSVSK